MTVRAIGFGRHLLRFGLAAVAPLLVVAAVTLAVIVDRYRDGFRAGRQATAIALAAALDGEIERLKPMLRALSAIELLSAATSPADLEDLHERASRHAAAFGTVIWAEHAGGAWLMTTAMPFAPGLRREGPVPEAIAQARARASAGGRPETTDLAFGALPDGRPTAAVSVPIIRGGEVVAWMGAAVLPDRLAEILAGHRLAPGEFAMLVDGNGRVAARAPDHGRFLGLSIPEWFARAAPAAAVGTLSGPSIAGQRTVISHARLVHSPRYFLALGTPEDAYLASWQRPLLYFGGGALASLGLAALGAGGFARRLLRRLQAVTAQAEAVAADRRPPPAAPAPGPRVAEFERLADAVRGAEAKLRAQAEAARREEALLRSVLGSATDAISVQDREGRYRMANPAAAALRGTTLPALIGRTDAEIGYAPAAHAAVGAGGAGPTEERLATPGGERILLTARAPWRDPATGALLGSVSVGHDITDRLQADARAREAERHMQALLRKATVSALASGIAHEISQPLSAALNLLHVARHAPPGDAKASAALADGEAQVLRAGAILQQIRRFLGNDPMERAPAAIGPLVEGAVRLAFGGAAPAGLVRLRIAPDLPLVSVSAVQVEQVVVNLVRNAAEALEDLPVGQPRRIDVAVLPAAGGGVELRIADTGPGLPAAIAARPFERFGSTKPGGSGLGLAICRAIVEEHGGRIAIGPQPGGGTEAVVTLPGGTGP